MKNRENLREIIKKLEEENAKLKEKLGMSLEHSNEELSLEKSILENCYIEEKTNSILKKIYNLLKKGSFKTLNALDGKSVEEFLEIRNSGVSVVSAIIVICRHYGIKIEYNQEAFSKKINNEFEASIRKYEDKIKFYK